MATLAEIKAQLAPKPQATPEELKAVVAKQYSGQIKAAKVGRNLASLANAFQTRRQEATPDQAYDNTPQRAPRYSQRQPRAPKQARREKLANTKPAFGGLFRINKQPQTYKHGKRGGKHGKNLLFKSLFGMPKK